IAKLTVRICVIRIDLALARQRLSGALALPEAEVGDAEFTIQPDSFAARLFQDLLGSLPVVVTQEYRAEQRESLGIVGVLRRSLLVIGNHPRTRLLHGAQNSLYPFEFEVVRRSCPA